jgi:hypothetical protein
MSRERMLVTMGPSRPGSTIRSPSFNTPSARITSMVVPYLCAAVGVVRKAMAFEHAVCAGVCVCVYVCVCVLCVVCVCVCVCVYAAFACMKLSAAALLLTHPSIFFTSRTVQLSLPV